MTQDTFASKAVFLEVRLRQALSSSSALGKPNLFRCALVCDAWERVAPLTGRHASLLSLLWVEIQQCIFADGIASTGSGPGARGFASRTPFFSEVKRLQQSEAELQARMRLWAHQRDSMAGELEERKKAVSHTLNSWNKALVLAGSKAQVGHAAY